MQSAASISEAEQEALAKAFVQCWVTEGEGKMLCICDYAIAFANELRSANMGDRAYVLAQELVASYYPRRYDWPEDLGEETEGSPTQSQRQHCQRLFHNGVGHGG